MDFLFAFNIADISWIGRCQFYWHHMSMFVLLHSCDALLHCGKKRQALHCKNEINDIIVEKLSAKIYQTNANIEKNKYQKIRPIVSSTFFEKKTCSTDFNSVFGDCSPNGKGRKRQC